MSSNQTPTTGLVLGNNTYDRMKFLVQIVLPALGVLYASLAEFWGFPKVQEVVGTIMALALFLGVVLRISSSNFTEPPSASTPVGNFVVTTNEETGMKSVKLDLSRDPADFVDNEQIVFNLTRQQTEPVEDPDEPREENFS